SIPSTPSPSYHNSRLAFFISHLLTTHFHTLSLHDALPICAYCGGPARSRRALAPRCMKNRGQTTVFSWSARKNRGLSPVLHATRSEEHTSELQVTWPSRMPSSA